MARRAKSSGEAARTSAVSLRTGGKTLRKSTLLQKGKKELLKKKKIGPGEFHALPMDLLTVIPAPAVPGPILMHEGETSASRRNRRDSMILRRTIKRQQVPSNRELMIMG